MNLVYRYETTTGGPTCEYVLQFVILDAAT